MPTGKVSLSSRSLTFKSTHIQLNVKTEFIEAKHLLDSAYNIFLVDLKALENQHTHNGDGTGGGGGGTNADMSRAAADAAAGNADTINSPIHSHAHAKSDLDKSNSQMKGNQHVENNVNSDVTGQNAAIDSSAKEAAPAAEAANANNANQNCDINKITINAEIQEIGDVFLHMEIDESYELNVTSTCFMYI